MCSRPTSPPHAAPPPSDGHQATDNAGTSGSNPHLSKGERTLDDVFGAGLLEGLQDEVEKRLQAPPDSFPELEVRAIDKCCRDDDVFDFLQEQVVRGSVGDGFDELSCQPLALLPIFQQFIRHNKRVVLPFPDRLPHARVTLGERCGIFKAFDLLKYLAVDVFGVFFFRVDSE